jgi:hypothetical protein
MISLVSKEAVQKTGGLAMVWLLAMRRMGEGGMLEFPRLKEVPRLCRLCSKEAPARANAKKSDKLGIMSRRCPSHIQGQIGTSTKPTKLRLKRFLNASLKLGPAYAVAEG